MESQNSEPTNLSVCKMTTHLYRITNNLEVGVSVHVDISPCDCPSVESFISSGATIVNHTVFACLILRYNLKGSTT